MFLTNYTQLPWINPELELVRSNRPKVFSRPRSLRIFLANIDEQQQHLFNTRLPGVEEGRFSINHQPLYFNLVVVVVVVNWCWVNSEDSKTRLAARCIATGVFANIIGKPLALRTGRTMDRIQCNVGDTTPSTSDAHATKTL